MDLIREIAGKFPSAVKEVAEYAGEKTLVVEAGQAKAVLRFLKEAAGFDYLADVSSAHWPEEGRIDVVYLPRSLKSREQVRVRAALPEENPVIETVSDLWPAADWMEREVYDLMGIRFDGHPNLSRVLLPEDFEGHPLRKEYPMEGDDEWRNYLPAEEKP